MKIKKVLCLSAVLGAVLSVGMVTSAMADMSVSVDTSKEVQIDLNKKDTDPANDDQAITDAIPTVKSDDGVQHVYKNIGFTNVTSIDNNFLTLSTGGSIEFKVTNACYVTITTPRGKTGVTDATISDGSDFNETIVSEKNNIITQQLTPGTLYTIKSTTKQLSIEEIDFTLNKPKLKTILQGNGGADDSNYKDTLAIYKDDETDPQHPAYYLIAVLNSSKGNSHSSILLTSGDTNKGWTDKIYKNLLIDDILYDAGYFGTSADFLCAFKLDNTEDELSAFEGDPATAKTLLDHLQFEFDQPDPNAEPAA